MNVVAYCRYSSEGQRDGYSIEAQRRAIEDWAKREGHTVVNYYIEEARTATNDSRPVFLDMIKDSAKRQFGAIVVHKLDRFARNRYDSAIYKHQLGQYGVKVISVLEPLDDSPESAMMEAMLEGMAEYYSRNLSREVQKGKKEAALQCKHAGGPVPYGYKLDADQHYIINEEEAVIIKQVFSKLAGGTTYAEVARWLNACGHRTHAGGYFSEVQIRRLVSNTMLIGRYTYAKKSKTGQEPIVFENAIEPIIDSELFWALNAQAKARERGPRPRKKEEEYPLTGFLFCECCGSHLYGFKSAKSTTKKDGTVANYEARFYRCARKNSVGARRFDPDFERKHCKLKSIRKEPLEDFVFKAIEEVLFTGATADWICAEMAVRAKRKKPSSSTLKTYKKELTTIENKKVRLLDLHLSGDIDKELFRTKMDELTAREKYLNQEVERLQGVDFSPTDLSKIKNALDAFRLSANADSIEYKRRLLSAFVDKITVSNDELTIYFKFGIPGSSDKVSYDIGNSFVRNGTHTPTCVLLRTKFALANIYTLDTSNCEMSIINT